MFSVNKLLKVTLICSGLILALSTNAAAGATSDVKEPDVKYTGVYKDRQLIPNIMAIHCKMNAEDVVKDMRKLELCIRQYVSEMNSDNAITAQEGTEDFNKLRYSILNDMLSTAITKSAAISGFEESFNEYAEANTKTETEYDSESALSNTQAFATDFLNSIRELLIEVVKYDVVNGVTTATPEMFGDEVAATEQGDKDNADTPPADAKKE